MYIKKSNLKKLIRNVIKESMEPLNNKNKELYLINGQNYSSLEPTEKNVELLQQKIDFVKYIKKHTDLANAREIERNIPEMRKILNKMKKALPKKEKEKPSEPRNYVADFFNSIDKDGFRKK